MSQLSRSTFASPVGSLTLVASEQGLVAVLLPGQRAPVHLAAAEDRPCRHIDSAARELSAYFEGRLSTFTTPLEPLGTPFQRRVWAALRAIPFAARTSYGAIARSLGMPTAGRAVGGANARNPIAIVVPCHRVVGANAALTGYAGGLAAKAWLLAHEAAHGAS